MPPDSPAHDWRTHALTDRIPDDWQRPLLGLTVGWVILIALAAREWGEMLHQWWNIDTYSHILLVPAIIVWLVVLKLQDLKSLTPQSWTPGLALVVAALGLWFAGRISGLNLLAHAGAVGMLQAAVIAILGLRISALLFLPLSFAVFLVPFGDEIIPQLQSVTAAIAIKLTEWSGIPAQIDGIYIDTPVGLFIVAEACSGVRFLIAMIALAVLVAFTRFESWGRRAAFLAAAVIIPIIANGIRAWGTIYIAQFQGVEFAAGFDHIVYGWVFFAIVVGIVLAGAWRFFEMDPEDYGYSSDELGKLSWLARFENLSHGLLTTVAAIFALVVSARILALIVAPVSIG